MKKTTHFKLVILTSVLFFISSVSAGASFSRREFFLQPVHKDTPSIVASEKEDVGQKCDIKMVRVKGNSRIKKPPLINANVLYYGEVKLGSPEKTYGLLIDFEGEKKLIWVDSDADGDFEEETSYAIFKSDRYPGINVFFSPMPLRFNLEYTLNDKLSNLSVFFDLPFLTVARTGYNDFLLLKTRTWLTTNLSINDEDLPLALVDTNFNGNFCDSEDLLYIDEDYDLNFSSSEAIEVKKASELRVKSGAKIRIDLTQLPEKLIITTL